MMGRLHFMGTPISPNATNQRDLTEPQRAFLNYAMIKYVQDEQDFQIKLHGGEPSPDRPGSVKDNAKQKVKDPRKLKRKR